MTHRHLHEADGAHHRRERSLVFRIAVAVHQHDGAGADAVGVRRAQVAFGGGEIELPDRVTMRAHALVDLDHALVEHARQHDPAYEELRTVLIGDAQGIGEAPSDRQHRALAFALEQGVGGNGRAHPDRLDRPGRNRRTRCDAEQCPDTGDGRVAVALRVLGQQLVRRQRAVGPARDDIGECTASVDPELPAARRRVGHDEEMERGPRRKRHAATTL